MLQRIIKHHNYSHKSSISIITHSLGGIIARHALTALSEKKSLLFDKLILLTPPNQGSKLARIIIKSLPFLRYIIKPLNQLSDDEKSYIHQIPTPKNIEIGIIAAKYDHAAPANTTQLKEQSDFTIIKGGHSLIMNNKKARQQILLFLQNGKFNPAKTIKE